MNAKTSFYRSLRQLFYLIQSNDLLKNYIFKFDNKIFFCSGDAFIFCALDLDDYLEWYRHLLELTLDFRRDLSTINK